MPNQKDTLVQIFKGLQEDHRDLKTIRDIFYNHYRTLRFTDLSLITDLNTLKTILNRLKNRTITVNGESENAMFYYFDYQQINEDIRQIGQQFFSTIDQTLNGIDILRGYQGSNDPIRFNEVWKREVDPKILWVINAFLLLENSARTHLQGAPAAGEIMIRKIQASDIVPLIPDAGGTIIVLQRNAKDNREKPGASDFGALYHVEAKKARMHAEAFFDNLFDRLSADEMKTVNVIVVASDATLIMPEGHNSPHKRAVETAYEVIEGLNQSLEKHSLSKKQLLNVKGTPLEEAALRDLLMFQQSAAFVKFLTLKHPKEKELWVEYEQGAHARIRAVRGVEGPDYIADRVYYAVLAKAQYAQEYHDAHKHGQRLIIWIVSHYDSISPFIKKHILGLDPAKSYVPIDQGGGITITMDAKGGLSCAIFDRKFKIV